MVTLKVGSSLHKMQTGFIYHYTLVILIGLTILFGLRQSWLFFGFVMDYRLFIIIFILVFFLVNSIKNNEEF